MEEVAPGTNFKRKSWNLKGPRDDLDRRTSMYQEVKEHGLFLKNVVWYCEVCEICVHREVRGDCLQLSGAMFRREVP